jgi:hypothetical protein
MSTGLLVQFATEEDLCRALERLRAADIRELRTYTPKPLEMEPARSPVPLIVLVGGLVGAAAAFAVQVYANTGGYPLDIGGRPEYSWPAFIPITFEVGVLWAVLAGVFGYFAVNRMPRLYEPVDELEPMRQALRDGWLVAIKLKEPQRLARARSIVEALGPLAVEELPS